MTPNGIITLSTDFGVDGIFAASMKGAILDINPNANVVDITHAIRPYDIKAAAYTIATVYRYFPTGTIHLVIVDPGVGGERAPIAVETSDYWFIAPDNGVLTEVLGSDNSYCAVRVKNHAVCQLSDCYDEGSAGTLIALFNSSDLLEIAVKQSSASQILDVSETCPATISIVSD